MATEKRLIDAISLISKARRMETTDNNGIPVDTYAVPVLAIEDAPTVDAMEVVHGRWITTPVYKFNRAGMLIKYCDNHHCSECRTEQPIVPPYNYCPNCGAKMDGDWNAAN